MSEVLPVHLDRIIKYLNTIKNQNDLTEASIATGFGSAKRKILAIETSQKNTFYNGE